MTALSLFFPNLSQLGDIVIKIFPRGIKRFNHFQLPGSFPFFHAFFAVQDIRYVFREFVIDQYFDAIFCREASDLSVFMFTDASNQIICYTTINRAISFAGKNVEVTRHVNPQALKRNAVIQIAVDATARAAAQTAAHPT